MAARWRVVASLILVALLVRAWDLGNPVIHVDEQYYLLVGDRLLHGAVPYIDIWDRKPFGLFLLYAGIRLLPGDGVLAYQLVAFAFAIATALVVRRGARLLGSDDRGALVAGALYLVGLSLLGGRGGQSPVFYNLPVALAGVLTLQLPGRPRPAIIASGAIACLLAGLAIQIKWTPAFEGAAFGIAHLYMLRRQGAAWPATCAATLLWIVAGLLPTLAVVAWYAVHGALDAFWFANVTSIFLRPGYPWDQLAMRLLGIAAVLLPLIACAVASWRRRDSEATFLAFVWLAAALLGFFAIGTFFDHYALPLLAPLAIAASPALARYRRIALAILGAGLALFAVERALQPSDAAGARSVARVVARNSRDGCPYVFIGDTITYRLADACLPTPYAFPNFLAYTTEQGAMGIDEAGEVRRILANRPPVIVTSTRRLAIWNQQSLAVLKPVLHRDYRPVFATPRSSWRTLVYLRRDLAYRR